MIFISYRRADSESVVGRIHSELKKHFPTQDVFLDHDSIPLGKPFEEVIRERLAASKFALVLIGPKWHSVADVDTGKPRLDDPQDFVRLEVETALATPGVSVIPLWVMRATSSSPEIAALPPSIRPLFKNNGMSIRPVPDEDADIQKLIRSIASQLDSDDSDAAYFGGRSTHLHSGSFPSAPLASQLHLQGGSTSLRRRALKPVSESYGGSTTIIGIDIGTTNSLAAICTEGEVRIAPNRLGYASTPSAVYIQPNGTAITGAAAVSMILRDPQHGLLHAKRLFGTQQTLAAYGNQYTASQIASELIKALRHDCERALGTVCNRAVVTVPAYFTQAQIDDVQAACAMAGLYIARIVAEPTAACLAAGDHLQRLESKNSESDYSCVAVFDLGGGTFDISILEFCVLSETDEQFFEILSVDGEGFLGGIDYDQAIIDYCIEQFYRATGVLLADNLTACIRLREAAELAKIELSTAEFATVFVPFIFANSSGTFDMNVQISRTGFESLTGRLTEKIIACCKRALDEAALEKVDYLLMIGLATRTPSIREKAEELFGTRAATFVDPDTAVALGAAIQASVLMGSRKDLLLLDITAHDIGVQTNSECMAVIIARNTSIPAERTVSFRTCNHNQNRVLLSVWQVNQASAARNVLLSQCVVDHLTADMVSPSRFTITVDIDQNHLVRVYVKDPASDRVKRIDVSTAPLFEDVDPSELSALQFEVEDEVREEQDEKEEDDELERWDARDD